MATKKKIKKFPHVAIIILNWKGDPETLDCVASLQKINYPNYTIVVVDNHSPDQSVAKLRQRFPQLKIIVNPRNLGFAAGNNVGLRWAFAQGADYFLLLNNDTEVEPDFLDHLVNYAENNSHLGMVGPLSCYYSQPELVQSAGIKFNPRAVEAQQIGVHQPRDQFTQPSAVPCLNGVALLVKREILSRVGLLDEDYFLYTEELDWCYRLQKAGYQLALVPSAVIYHKIPLRGRQDNPFVLYHRLRGRVIFFRKHIPPYYFPFFFWSLLKLIFWPWRKPQKARLNFKLTLAALQGFFSGLRAPLTQPVILKEETADG